MGLEPFICDIAAGCYLEAWGLSGGAEEGPQCILTGLPYCGAVTAGGGEGRMVAMLFPQFSVLSVVPCASLHEYSTVPLGWLQGSLSQ